MNSIGKGIVAGFAATVVLSVLMLIKEAMGVMPQVDPIGMLSGVVDAPPAVGWIAHFFIGSIVWGVLFAWIERVLPGPHWVRGIIFAVGAWVLMMILVMPMAGAGLFGMQMGMMASIATFLMHVVYGAVLGGIYGAVASEATARTGESYAEQKPRRADRTG